MASQPSSSPMPTIAAAAVDATTTTTTAPPLQASHLDTRLASPSLPILLRTISLRDAAAMSALVSAPENAGADPNARPLTPDRCAANIARQRIDASVPSVLDPAATGGGGGRGRVLSGPSRVNMAVILLPSRREEDAPPLAGEEGEDENEEEQSETMIGLGGFGAIKDWVRDGTPLRAGDVGVMLAPAHRRRGYAAEAMRLAIDWAFTPVAAGGPQLDLVTVTTLAGNEPMVRLAEDRLGLRGRGVLRPAAGEHGESTVGELYYELTAEAWKRLRSEGVRGGAHV
ncbi:hypothetical protein JDV02_007593 [Purpureocillium takamizusanense]|uniref:N-acetyltransferase domain-containing protein n=1 Tax=Purpureocillium takamizusanense TaxID=2060973 RepID=A0A9Q8VEA7_9HYPO|nr:uncharacterized protein JDV02_007593 [Purpureocillium takamizusanense]UNI21617.1 hypothetical protein JDV02_007593 [Purpureocillium takamizusanense]